MKGKEKERERNISVWLPLVCPLLGDLAHNPGMCPDWESNCKPFGLQACAQSTEPHQPRPFNISYSSSLLVINSFSLYIYICLYFAFVFERHFTGYRILGWQIFSSPALKMFFPTVVSCLMFVPFVCEVSFFSLPNFKVFLFITAMVWFYSFHVLEVHAFSWIWRSIIFIHYGNFYLFSWNNFFLSPHISSLESPPRVYWPPSSCHAAHWYSVILILFSLCFIWGSLYVLKCTSPPPPSA